MKTRHFLFILLVFLLMAAPVQAALTNFRTFTAEGANLSIDAVGLNDNTDGIVQAAIPNNAVIEAAYLYSASVWSSSLANVTFDGNLLTSNAASRLDVGPKQANPASENRWDVTSIVQTKYNANTALGTYDFTVKENGYLDGEILAVLYKVPSKDIQTAFIFDGELATTGDSFKIGLAEAFDGKDAIFSLGISFGHQPSSQYTQVDVNGQRMTTSAGGEDDGFNSNGGLITAGGIGDSITNPADPNVDGFSGPFYDDELYNLASFLKIGDTLIDIRTLNPSNDDNVFFAGLVTSGRAVVNEVPEPATLLLIGLGLAGIASTRKRYIK